MLRSLVKLLIVALVVHAAWRVVPVYVTHVRFKDRLEETVRFPGSRSEAQLLGHVLEIASGLGVPLEREAVTVRRNLDHTSIDLTYTEILEVVPLYHYPWTFVVQVEGASAR